jgi:hypothetical protein
LAVLSFFTAFGLAASAGLNAYIPLLVVALLARFAPNLITLASPWDGMTSWWIIGLLIFLVIIEFIADKVPVVNHINDIVMTIIRPAAGAIVFAAATSQAINEINPIFALALGIIVAGSVHAAKSVVVRPVVTATTGSAGNVPVSMAEDGVSTAVSVTSILVPILVIGILLLLLVVFILFMVKRRQKKKRTPAYKERDRKADDS